MLSKVMRIPRQQEVTALRTYLQIRIGLHAAFNACEEMCQRVALERQLDNEERALLIERSQTVIRQGRDILHAQDATRNSAQALDNALQPDKQLSLPTPRRNTLPVWQPHSAVLLK